jgi:hypothetical protein
LATAETGSIEVEKTIGQFIGTAWSGLLQRAASHPDVFSITVFWVEKGLEKELRPLFYLIES